MFLRKTSVKVFLSKWHQIDKKIVELAKRKLSSPEEKSVIFKTEEAFDNYGWFLINVNSSLDFLPFFNVYYSDMTEQVRLVLLILCHLFPNKSVGKIESQPGIALKKILQCFPVR